MISGLHTGATHAPGDMSGLRHELHQCLIAQADALSELNDAALCAKRQPRRWSSCTRPPNTNVAMAPCTTARSGRIDTALLRNVLARQTIPRCGGQIVSAIDVSHCLRPDTNRAGTRLQLDHRRGHGSGYAALARGCMDIDRYLSL